MRRLMGLFFGLAACGSSVSYDQVVAVCGDEPVPVDAEWESQALDQPCVELLAVGIGLDWEGFSAEPAPFNRPDTEWMTLLVALRTLSVIDTGTIGELREASGGRLADELRSHRARRGWADNEGANRFFFERVTERIWHTKADFEGVKIETDGGAQYEATRGILGRTLQTHATRTTGVIIAAADLVHETTHTFRATNHIECDSGVGRYCDANEDGAHGTELTWMSQVVEHSPGTLETCRQLSMIRSGSCRLVHESPAACMGLVPPCE